MITSVQSIQSSIKNAPDNVLGMVKGISDNLLSNSVVDSLSKINTPSSGISSQNSQSSSTLYSATTPTTPQNNQSILSPGNLSNSMTSSTSNSKINQQELNAIDRTVLNGDDIQSNNLPVRVIIMLIDEIFDLKEKNQWLRQSLMAVVKTFMRNFKGDSMNRKIKEQIADYLSEEYIARYLKNFRKRMWPKGYLAEYSLERTKSAKEITKVLVKTKLLALVSDELRHILGNDTTRRGIFDVFELFQHKPLNKRFCYIIIENLLINFFQTGNNPNSTSFQASSLTSSSTTSFTQTPQLYLSNPLSHTIRLHLSKSSKIKSEWRSNYKQRLLESKLENSKAKPRMSIAQSAYSISSILSTPTTANKSQMQAHMRKTSILQNDITFSEQDGSNNKNENSIPRSKSLYSDIQC